MFEPPSDPVIKGVKGDLRCFVPSKTTQNFLTEVHTAKNGDDVRTPENFRHPEDASRTFTRSSAVDLTVALHLYRQIRVQRKLDEI